jgi:hypothetical protein
VRTPTRHLAFFAKSGAAARLEDVCVCVCVCVLGSSSHACVLVVDFTRTTRVGHLRLEEVDFGFEGRRARVLAHPGDVLGNPRQQRCMHTGRYLSERVAGVVECKKANSGAETSHPDRAVEGESSEGVRTSESEAW